MKTLNVVLILTMISSFMLVYMLEKQEDLTIEKIKFELKSQNFSLPEKGNFSIIVVPTPSIYEKISISSGISNNVSYISNKATIFNGNRNDFEKLVRNLSLHKVYINYDYYPAIEESLKISRTQNLITNYSVSAQGIKIAFLDSGKKEGSKIYSQDFTQSSTVVDKFNHGKFVEEILLQTAPNVTLLNLKVLNDNGIGNSLSLYQAIIRAVELDVNIIHMSLGVPVYEDKLVKQAIDYAINNGIVIIASSGNCADGSCGNWRQTTFPANMKEVMAVGSIAKSGSPSVFSSSFHSNDLIKPDVVAIGENMRVLAEELSGTSFAAPQISGILASYMAENSIINQDTAFSLLKKKSLDLGEKGKDDVYGFGFLDSLILFDKSLNYNNYSSNYSYSINNNFENLFSDDYYDYSILDSNTTYGEILHNFEFNNGSLIIQELDFNSKYSLINYISENFEKNYSGELINYSGTYYWFYNNSLYKTLYVNNSESKIYYFPKEFLSKLKYDSVHVYTQTQEIPNTNEYFYTAQYGANSPKEAKNGVWYSKSNYFHLKFGETNPECYSSENEDNWYYTSTSEKGDLHFELTSIKSGADLDLYVYDYTGENLLCKSSGKQYSFKGCSVKKTSSSIWAFYIKINPKELPFLRTCPNSVVNIHLHNEVTNSCNPGFIKGENSCSLFDKLYGKYQYSDCTIKNKLISNCNDYDGYSGKYSKPFCKDSRHIQRSRTFIDSTCSISKQDCDLKVDKKYEIVEKCSYGCNLGGSVCNECTLNSHCSSDEVCSNTICINKPEKLINCYRDKDSDGFGDKSEKRFFETKCDRYAGYDYVENNDDCNDNSKNINPQTLWFIDEDSDGYILDYSAKTSCVKPDKGYRANFQIITPIRLDCNDEDNSLTSNCRGKDICSGKYQIITQDSTRNPINNIKIFENGEYQGVTNNFGELTLFYTNTNCYESQDIELVCGNLNRLCDKDTIYLNKKENFNSQRYDCSVCLDIEDISINKENIVIGSNSINVSIQSLGIEGEVGLKIFRQMKGGFQEVSGLPLVNISIKEDSSTLVNISKIDLEGVEYLHFYIDYSQNGSGNYVESDESNNYMIKKIPSQSTQKTTVYFDIELSSKYSILEEIFKKFLSEGMLPIKSRSDADIIVMVGEKASRNFNSYFNVTSEIDPHKFYFDTVFETSDLDKPYNSKIVIDYPGLKPRIRIFSKDIQGYIAGVKRLKNRFNEIKIHFKNFEESRYIIDNYDQLGIQVMDKINRGTLGIHFDNNGKILANAVTNVLYDNTLEVAIKPVRTFSDTSYNKKTDLRIKHIDSDYSQIYKDTFQKESKPIVLGAGLWNNLEFWDLSTSFFPIIETTQSLSTFLSHNGYSSWSIEITGGPKQDANKHYVNSQDIPNYNFEDISTVYYPALIGGVLEYSKSNDIIYLGYSNGCRTALSSMQHYQHRGKENVGEFFNFDTGYWEEISPLKPSFIDTFIGAGCPGSFEGYSWYSHYLGGSFGKKIQKANENYSHLTKKMVGEELLKLCISLNDEDEFKQCSAIAQLMAKEYPITTVSRNLLEYYLNLISSSTDQGPLFGSIDVRNTRLYTNKFSDPNWVGIFKGHFYKSGDFYQDIAVSNNDTHSIAKNINSEFEDDEIKELVNFWHGRFSHREFREDLLEVLQR